VIFLVYKIGLYDFLTGDQTRGYILKPRVHRSHTGECCCRPALGQLAGCSLCFCRLYRTEPLLQLACPGWREVASVFGAEVTFTPRESLISPQNTDADYLYQFSAEGVNPLMFGAEMPKLSMNRGRD
jgi:hypothetical protein